MPVRLGYLMGIAVTVIVEQLPKLFGFSVDAESFVRGAIDFVSGLDETNATALALGAGSLVLMLGLRRFAPRVPGRLHRGRRRDGDRRRAGPRRSRARWSAPSPPACRTSASPTSRSTTSRRWFRPRSGSRSSRSPTRACCRAATRAGCTRTSTRTGSWRCSASPTSRPGSAQGFPISSSSSRTAVAEDVGAKSQFAGLAGAAVLALLLHLRDRPAPRPADGDAGRDRDRRRPGVHRHRRRAAAAAVAALGVRPRDGRVRRRRRARRAVGRRDRDRPVAAELRPPGVAPARRRARARRQPQGLPRHRALSRRPPDPGARALPLRRAALLRQRRLLPRARRARWRAPDDVPVDRRRRRADDRHRRHRRRDARRPSTSELDAAGVELAFAELKDPVRDRLRRYGIEDAIGADRFFPTLGVAVAAYLGETGVDWLDWEERAPSRPSARPRR